MSVSLQSSFFYYSRNKLRNSKLMLAFHHKSYKNNSKKESNSLLKNFNKQKKKIFESDNSMTNKLPLSNTNCNNEINRTHSQNSTTTVSQLVKVLLSIHFEKLLMNKMKTTTKRTQSKMFLSLQRLQEE